MSKQQTTEQIQEAIKQALELYNSFYGDIVRKMNSGQFFTSFLTVDDINSLVNRIERYLNNTQFEDLLSDGEKQLNKKLQSLAKSGFANSVLDAYRGIADNAKAIRLENAFNNGTFNDVSLQSSVELLKLIDSELYRQEKTQKKSIDVNYQAQAIEAVIQKALRTPSLYEMADMGKIKPYLESALTATECDRYIRQINDVVELYEVAKKSISDVDLEKDLTQLSYYANTEDVDSSYKEFFEKCDPTQEMEGIVKDFTNFVVQLVEGSVKEVPESLKDVRTSDRVLIDELVGKKDLSKAEIVEVIKAIELQIAKKLQSYATLIESATAQLEKMLTMMQYYQADNVNADKRLTEIVDERQRNGRGLFRGRIIANTTLVSYDDNSGEVETAQESKEITFTDQDLMNIISCKLIRHSSAITFVMKENMKNCSTLAELAEQIKIGYNTIETWIDELDGEVEAIIAFYDKLLDMDAEIQGFATELRQSLTSFLDDFDPKGKRSGVPYFNEETLDAMRKYGKEAVEVELKIRDVYYQEASRLFVCGVLEYFNSLELDERYFSTLEEYLDTKKMAKKSSIVDLLNQDQQITCFELYEKTKKTIKLLQDPKTAKIDISMILSNPDIASGIQPLIPFFVYELSYGTLNNMINAEEVIKGKRVSSAKQIELFTSESMNSMDIAHIVGRKGKGMFTTSAFYDYLKERLVVFKSTLNKAKAEFARRSNMGYEIDPITLAMLNDCENMYNDWLGNLKEYMAEKDKPSNEETLEDLLQELKRQAGIEDISGQE